MVKNYYLKTKAISEDDEYAKNQKTDHGQWCELKRGHIRDLDHPSVLLWDLLQLLELPWLVFLFSVPIFFYGGIFFTAIL